MRVYELEPLTLRSRIWLHPTKPLCETGRRCQPAHARSLGIPLARAPLAPNSAHGSCLYRCHVGENILPDTSLLQPTDHWPEQMLMAQGVPWLSVSPTK